MSLYEYEYEYVLVFVHLFIHSCSTDSRGEDVKTGLETDHHPSSKQARSYSTSMCSVRREEIAHVQIHTYGMEDSSFISMEILNPPRPTRPTH
jgi:hypothetical protein